MPSFFLSAVQVFRFPPRGLPDALAMLAAIKITEALATAPPRGADYGPAASCPLMQGETAAFLLRLANRPGSFSGWSEDDRRALK